MNSEGYKIKYEFSESNSNGKEGVISDGIHSMPFVLRLGARNIKKRLLVILHGHGANKSYAKYQNDEWDILCPLDLYGTEGLGCWWLGEHGNFFVYQLLQKLILQVKLENEIEALYFWGSSMGGYGAILHGTLLGADAVYAHMPQIKLSGTDYTDGLNLKYYQHIFSEDKKYQDLVGFIDSCDDSSGPVFFLSQNVFDYPNYIEQHFLPLIVALSQKKMAYKSNMNLKQGHVLYEKIFESVNNSFLNFESEIYNWKIYKSIEDPTVVERQKLLRMIDQSLKLEIIKNLGYLSVIFNDLGNNYYYACYLYSGDVLVEKTKYQKKAMFDFAMRTTADKLSVKLYIQDRKNKIRVSKSYSIM